MKLFLTIGYWHRLHEFGVPFHVERCERDNEHWYQVREKGEVLYRAK